MAVVVIISETVWSAINNRGYMYI